MLGGLHVRAKRRTIASDIHHHGVDDLRRRRTAQQEISDLMVKLGQPAFGVESGLSSVDKGFPKGALILIFVMGG